MSKAYGANGDSKQAEDAMKQAQRVYCQLVPSSKLGEALSEKNVERFLWSDPMLW